MKQAFSSNISLNHLQPVSSLAASLQPFPYHSKPVSLEEEVEKTVNAFLVKKGLIPWAYKKDELKNILFCNLRFNREAKQKIREKIDWNRVNFDIATSARDCLAAYALVFSRYEPLGFNDLTLIEENQDESNTRTSTISGLNYDDNDKRAVTVIIKGNGELNGTLRLISGDTGLLPTEILFDKQNGMEHIRKQLTEKGKSISEISKLALNPKANPMVHYKTLVVSKSLLAKPLNIGNEISLVPKPEFDRRYQRIGFVAELTRRFYRELEQPDVICSWDQDTQLSDYYLNIVQKETQGHPEHQFI